MNYYFTSDLHLGHDNIRRYSDRPFESLDEMNDKLIKKWNERVSEEDQIFHIGDFSFFRSTNGNGQKVHPKEFLKKLNGQIILIQGNHDQNNSVPTKIHRLVLCLADIKVNLVHDPDHGDLEYPINLHGHIHKQGVVKVVKKDDKESLFINVGCDVWDYYPISWQKVQQIYDQWRVGQDVERIYKKF